MIQKSYCKCSLHTFAFRNCPFNRRSVDPNTKPKANQVVVGPIERKNKSKPSIHIKLIDLLSCQLESVSVKLKFIDEKKISFLSLLKTNFESEERKLFNWCQFQMNIWFLAIEWKPLERPLLLYIKGIRIIGGKFYWVNGKYLLEKNSVHQKQNFSNKVLVQGFTSVAYTDAFLRVFMQNIK